jgi:hypothetical protein
MDEPVVDSIVSTWFSPGHKELGSVGGKCDG